MTRDATQVRGGSPRHGVKAHAQEVPPEYKRTEVGVIPNRWDVVAIPKVLTNIIDYRGRTPRKLGMEWGGDIPALSARNVRMGRIDLEQETYYGSEKLYRRWMTNGEAKRGDIVFTMEAPLGNVAVIPDNRRYILSQRTILIQPDPSVIDGGFLFFFLTSAVFQQRVHDNATGSTATGIQRKKLERLSIALPTLLEQRAIAEALSDVDGLLEALEALIAKKRAIKQAAMQQLLTGKTRLPGFSGEWETKRLGELGHFLKGSSVKRDEAGSGPLACIRYGEIYTTHHDYIRTFRSWISSEVANTATRLEYGDLLFAGSGETKEEIGKCVAFVTEVEAYAGGDIVILRPKDVDPLFLGYVLNAPYVVRQKTSFGQGDAVVHISAKALAQVEVALPSTTEQAAIATVLSDMDAEIAALEARRDKTRQIKQGMMQQLLTGRVRLVKPDAAA